MELMVKNGHQELLLSQELGQLLLDPHPLFTPGSSAFGLVQAIDSSLTLPMSHHKHDEWLDKVELVFLNLKWSPQAVFESQVGTNVARSTPTFHTNIECVWTNSAIS